MTEKEKLEIVGPINNPEFLGMLNKEVEELAKKLGIVSIKPQSLWTHLYRSVQRYSVQSHMGQIPIEELWVVTKEDAPVAFGHWVLLSDPYIGTVFCDYVYSWNTAKEPFQMLVDKFIEFGKKHGCQHYMAEAINERVFTVCQKALRKRNLDITKYDIIKFIGRRK